MLKLWDQKLDYSNIPFLPSKFEQIITSISAMGGKGRDIIIGNLLIHKNIGPSLYSLYSAAMQIPLRWGLVLVYTPNTRILSWEYQHVGS